MTTQLPELLAPVRDAVSLTAAIQAGADAVYFGLGQLNMRLNSPGFAAAQLADIVRQAHQNEVKVYVALNTIIYDSELGLLELLLRQCRDAAADAVIAWDPAVISWARRFGLAVHISTQASVSNAVAADFYRQLGASRVVLARELTLEQIRTLKGQTSLQIEVFAHGAMCVSVSGRCFMSQFLYNRSANRGDCLQPCRREYRVIDTETEDELEISNGYVMSPQDLCTLPILDQMVAANIDVLKIEGRSRAPEYIHTVVGVYRQALDAIAQNCFNGELVQTLMDKLRQVYNRGFSTGFFLGRPAPDSWTDTDGSQATRTKEYVGRVANYYPRAGAVYVELVRPLLVNDIVQFHGPTTGVYETVVTSLRSEQGQDLSAAAQGAITFPCPQKVRKNDQLYRIILKDTPPSTL